MENTCACSRWVGAGESSCRSQQESAALYSSPRCPHGLLSFEPLTKELCLRTSQIIKTQSSRQPRLLKLETGDFVFVVGLGWVGFFLLLLFGFFFFFFFFGFLFFVFCYSRFHISEASLRLTM
jgi:hypothetical protein